MSKIAKVAVRYAGKRAAPVNYSINNNRSVPFGLLAPVQMVSPAEAEVLVNPKQSAKDAEGKPIRLLPENRNALNEDLVLVGAKGKWSADDKFEYVNQPEQPKAKAPAKEEGKADG